MVTSLITLPDMPRKPLPEGEKRAPLAARVLPSLLNALQRMAEDDDRSLSYMVEKAIAEYVERHDGKPAGRARPRPGA